MPLAVLGIHARKRRSMQCDRRYRAHVRGEPIGEIFSKQNNNKILIILELY